MTKILLVEDDSSLREIYGVRLLAEGYDIVSASDGEQALAMAIKERPTLIITDVMMPKISGFDMLDILRSTTETRPIKVIVMTALGSDEQRARGDQLGADRYLVKSQVGIEDVVRAVHEVLGDQSKQAAGVQPRPLQTAPGTVQSTDAPTPNPIPQTQRSIVSQPPLHVTTAPPAASMPPQSATSAPTPVPVGRNRVIQPINPSAAKVNINDLLDRELAREAGIDFSEQQPAVPTTSEEKATIQDQLNHFNGLPTVPPPPSTNAPTLQIDASGKVISQPPQQ